MNDHKLPRKRRRSPRYRHARRWTPREKLVLSRYVKAVRAGKYATMTEPVLECFHKLRAQSWRGKAGWTRTSIAVYRGLVTAVRASGAPLTRTHWSPAELQVVGRYVRALFTRRYTNVPKAASDCHRALKELRRRVLKRNPAHPRPPVIRTWCAVRRLLAERSRGIGKLAGGSRRTDQEIRVLDRYARVLASGRYPTGIAVGRLCRQALVRLNQAVHPARQRTIPPSAKWLQILLGRRVRMTRGVPGTR